MVFKRVTLAVAAASVLLASVPAGAQYYEPYGRPPPPRYDYDRPPPRDWRYDRPPPPPYGYERPGYDRPPPYRARRFGDYCETGRGACPIRPQPIGSSCRCYIDGFGEKRGIVQ